MSSEKPFGAVLRGLRQQSRWTIEELAEASGVSVRAIGDMEQGRSRVPQRRTVAALADGLGLAGAEREALLAAARAGRPARTAAVTGTAVPPRSVGDFTGRAPELARLREAAERVCSGVGGKVAVVSGPPGCGKTTLALKAAADLAGEFPDGCFTVDLHGVDGPVDPDEALLQLLKALGVSDRRLAAEDTAGRAGLLRALLGERRCLVVLDNARDEGQVRDLLPGGGASWVLVTSRRSLTEASRDSWRSGGEEAAIEADETIYAQGLVLAPVDGGTPLTEFLLRVNGDKARFRHCGQVMPSAPWLGRRTPLAVASWSRMPLSNPVLGLIGAHST
ncbi:helix-turn-helix domain-containing protein [Streptomyces sp. NPDC048106]|uniref:helix-turn-helix domain-containing protein n=1 Tax=Streptomyces sp. NPDC048106 TaxID=3155750 RepID=UPI0034521105